jgi:hypothetical protein
MGSFTKKTSPKIDKLERMEIGKSKHKAVVIANLP